LHRAAEEDTWTQTDRAEFLPAYRPALWEEIQSVVAGVSANKCRTKVSKERTMKGELLFSPIDMNLNPA